MMTGGRVAYQRSPVLPLRVGPYLGKILGVSKVPEQGRRNSNFSILMTWKIKFLEAGAGLSRSVQDWEIEKFLKIFQKNLYIIEILKKKIYRVFESF